MSGINVKAVRETLSTFWQERKPRERLMLQAGAAALVLALFYGLLIGPMLDSRKQLEKNLPPLRQQAADLREMSRQAADLLQGAAVAPAISKESVEAALTQKGLKPQSVVLSGELVRVQLTSVSFFALMEWLDEMQKKSRLAVLEANIAAQPAVDVVNATLTLKQRGGNVD
jgi:general secretion pathway protein M